MLGTAGSCGEVGGGALEVNPPPAVELCVDDRGYRESFTLTRATRSGRALGMHSKREYMIAIQLRMAHVAHLDDWGGT